MTTPTDLREGLIVRGNIFPEPVKIITIVAIDKPSSIKRISAAYHGRRIDQSKASPVTFF